jgi:hypothetical protein
MIQSDRSKAMVRRTVKMVRRDDIVVRPRLTRREVISIRATLEELGAARCPVCRALLVARQGRAGPGFFCRCATAPRKRAS